MAWPYLTLRVPRNSAIALVVGLLPVAAVLLLTVSTPSIGLGLDESQGRLIGFSSAVLLAPVLIGVVLDPAARLSPATARNMGRVVVAAAVGVLAIRTLDVPGDGFFHGRIDIFEVAVETALDRPLFGAGADAFWVASTQYQSTLPSRTMFAHNMVLESWAELGILGLAATSGIYATTLWRAFVNRLHTEAILAIPCAVGFLLSGLADWSWHLPAMTLMWAMCVGALVSVER